MRPFQEVRLTTDRYIDEGVKAGDIGYILEDFGDKQYEVEFSDSSNGFTIALLVIPGEDLELAEDE